MCAISSKDRGQSKKGGKTAAVTGRAHVLHDTGTSVGVGRQRFGVDVGKRLLKSSGRTGTQFLHSVLSVALKLRLEVNFPAVLGNNLQFLISKPPRLPFPSFCHPPLRPLFPCPLSPPRSLPHSFSLILNSTLVDRQRV